MASLPPQISPGKAISFFFNLSSLEENEDKTTYILSSIDRYLSVFDQFEDPDLVSRMKREQIFRFGAALPLIFPVTGDQLTSVCQVVPKIVSQLGELPAADRYLGLFKSILTERKETMFDGELQTTVTALFKSPPFVNAFIKENQFVPAFTEFVNAGLFNEFMNLVESIHLLAEITDTSQISEVLCHIANIGNDSQLKMIERILNSCKSQRINNIISHEDFYRKLPSIIVNEAHVKVRDFVSLVYDMSMDKTCASKFANEVFRSGTARKELIKLASDKEMISDANIMEWYLPEILECPASLEVFIYSLLDCGCSEAYSVLIKDMKKASLYDEIARFLLENTKRYDPKKIFEDWNVTEITDLCSRSRNLTKLIARCCELLDFTPLPQIKALVAENNTFTKFFEDIITANINEVNVLRFTLENLDDEVCYRALLHNCLRIENYEKKLRLVDCFNRVKEDKECWRRFIEVLPIGFYDFDDFVMNLDENSTLFRFFQELRSIKFPSLVCFRAVARDLPFYDLYEIGRYAVPVAIKVGRNIANLGRVLSRFVREEDLRKLALKYPVLVGKWLDVDYSSCEFYELYGDRSCWIDCRIYGSSLDFEFCLERADDLNSVTLMTFNDVSLYIKGNEIFGQSQKPLASVNTYHWNKLSVNIMKGMRVKIDVVLNSTLIWSLSSKQLAVESIGDKTTMRGAHLLVKPKQFFIPRGNTQLVPFMSSASLFTSKKGISWLFEEFGNGSRQLIDVITRIPRLLSGDELSSFYEQFIHSLVVIQSETEKIRHAEALMESILSLTDVSDRTRIYEMFVFDFAFIESLSAREASEWVNIISRIEKVDHRMLFEDEIGSLFLAVSQKMKNQTISCKLVGLLMSFHAIDKAQLCTSHLCDLALSANQFGLDDLTPEAVMYRLQNRDEFHENIAEALFRQKCLTTEQMMFLALKLHNLNLVAEMFERVFPETKNVLILGKIAERLNCNKTIRAFVVNQAMSHVRYIPILILLLTSLASSTEQDVISECFTVLKRHGKKIYDEVNLPYFVNLLRCGKAVDTDLDGVEFLLDRFFVEASPSSVFVDQLSNYLASLLIPIMHDQTCGNVLMVLANNLHAVCLESVCCVLFEAISARKMQRKALLHLKDFVHAVFERGMTGYKLFVAILAFCQNESSRWSHFLDLMLIYCDHNTIIEILNMCEQSVFMESEVTSSLLAFQLHRFDIQWGAVGEGEVMSEEVFESLRSAPSTLYIPPKTTCVELLCNFMCPILAKVLHICANAASCVTLRMNHCLRIHERVFANTYMPDRNGPFWLSQMHSVDTAPLIAVRGTADTKDIEVEEVDALTFGLGRLAVKQLKNFPREMVKYMAEFGDERKIDMFEAVYGRVITKCNATMAWVGGSDDCVILRTADDRLVLLTGARTAEDDIVYNQSNTMLSHAILSGLFGSFSVFSGHLLIDFSLNDIETCRQMICCTCESMKIELCTISHGCFILTIKGDTSDLLYGIPICERHCKTDLWMSRQMSTFEYIMDLNMKGQRSFCDTTRYPVFPRVVKSFEGEHFSVVFGELRNMHKSLGGKHGVSSPSSVSSFNGNLLPFESANKLTAIQSLNITQGQSELTPELFCVPEVLNGVALPSWAKSPFHFLELHNYCLEKCSSIEKWFDRVFGCDQKSFDSNDLLYFKSVCASDRHQYQNQHGLYPLQVFLDNHPVRAPETNYQVKWDLVLDNGVEMLNNLIDWRKDCNAFITSLASKLHLSEYSFWESFVISHANWSREFKLCISNWSTVLPESWISSLIDYSQDKSYIALTFAISWVAVIRLVDNNLFLSEKKFLESPKSTVLNSAQRVAVTLCNSETTIWSFASGSEIATIPGKPECAVFDTSSIFIAHGNTLHQYTLNGTPIREISLEKTITALAVFRCGFTVIDMVVCVGDISGSVAIVKASLDNKLQIARAQKLSEKAIAGFTLDDRKRIISVFDVSSVY